MGLDMIVSLALALPLVALAFITTRLATPPSLAFPRTKLAHCHSNNNINSREMDMS